MYKQTLFFAKICKKKKKLPNIYLLTKCTLWRSVMKLSVLYFWSGIESHWHSTTSTFMSKFVT